MKKRIILGFMLMITTVFLLCGCESSVINLESDIFVVPVGEEISTDPGDYVRASKDMLAQMRVDVSQVNKDAIGTYSATIIYGEVSKHFYIEVADELAPEIVLKADKIEVGMSQILHIDDVLEEIVDFSDCEYGFSDDMTLSDKNKKMLSEKVFSSLGEHLIEVIAKDEFGNCSVEELIVNVVMQEVVLPDDPVGEPDTPDNPGNDGNKEDGIYAEYMNTNPGVDLVGLDTYNSAAVSYGIGTAVDKKTNRPVVNYYIDNYGDYAVDFIQPESQYVWLTFNEITEYGTTSKILDTLKAKNVKAVFFITLSYAKNNPALVERMIDEGHVLGNYTANCAKVPELSVKDLTNELDSLYNYVYQTYGYEMYLFRTPSGNFSERALAVAQSKGYRTVFWSFNYVDWNTAAQPDVTTSLENAVNKVHGGAIYLLSGSSTTNQQMLPDMIDGIRAKGFEFAVYHKN